MVNRNDRVEQVISATVAQLGYDLVDMQISRHKVEVFIDKQAGGISVEECTAVSRALSEALDTEDLFDSRYTLEVSSPGARRRLKGPTDFNRVLNQPLAVTTSEPVHEQNVFTGRLTGVRPDAITLDCDGKQVVLAYRTIAKASVKYEP